MSSQLSKSVAIIEKDGLSSAGDVASDVSDISGITNFLNSLDLDGTQAEGGKDEKEDGLKPGDETAEKAEKKKKNRKRKKNKKNKNKESTKDPLPASAQANIRNFGFDADLASSKNQHSAFLPENSLFKAGADDKFKGLFAIEEIKKGTRVLSEEPLIALPAPGDQVNLIWSAFKALTPGQQSHVWALPTTTFYPRHLKQWSDMIDMVVPVATELCTKKTPLSQKEAEALQLIGEKMGPMMAAWRLSSRFFGNRFSLSTESVEDRNKVPSEVEVTGLFLTVPRFQHSCVPNCYITYNHINRRMTIHATRDIAKGEELTVTNLGSAIWYHMADRRKDLLAEAEPPMACDCAACDPKSPVFEKQENLRRLIHLRTVALEGVLNLLRSSGFRPGDPTEMYALPLEKENIMCCESSILDIIKMLREADCADQEVIRWRLALVNEIHPRIGGKAIASLAQLKMSLALAKICWGEDHPDLAALQEKEKAVEKRSIEEREEERKKSSSEEAIKKRLAQ